MKWVILITLLLAFFSIPIVDGAIVANIGGDGGSITEVDPIANPRIDSLNATLQTDYFNKTQTNSTGFIGLICSNNQIMRWSGLGWICANEVSGGISQIFSGNLFAFITGGDTVNINITQFDERYYNKTEVYNTTEVDALFDTIDFSAYSNTTEVLALLDNNTIIRVHNTSWITDNQVYYNDNWINATFYNISEINTILLNYYNTTEVDALVANIDLDLYALINGSNQPFTNPIAAPEVSFNFSANFVSTQIGMCFNGSAYIIGNYTGVSGCPS